jgi:hypothetical protein
MNRHVSYFGQRFQFASMLNVHTAATAFTRSHIPDIATQDGFLDVVLVGNLIELADVINRTFYNHTVTADVREEQNIARCRYRRFQTWFSERFVIFMEDYWISSSYIFKRSLLELSAAIVGYKFDKEGTVKAPAHCTAKAVERAVRRHFQNDWPDLEPKLSELLRNPPSELSWTGPQIHIRKRPVEPLSPILLEFIDFPPHRILPVPEETTDEDPGHDEANPPEPVGDSFRAAVEGVVGEEGVEGEEGDVSEEEEASGEEGVEGEEGYVSEEEASGEEEGEEDQPGDDLDAMVSDDGDEVSMDISAGSDTEEAGKPLFAFIETPSPPPGKRRRHPSADDDGMIILFHRMN